MIGRLLGGMGVLLLGALATTGAVPLMLGYAEPIGGWCEAVRVGGPLLALGATALVLIAPLLVRRLRVRLLSGWRLAAVAMAMAVALPVTAIALIASGALEPGDPFAGRPFPLAGTPITADSAVAVDLRFKGKIGQIFNVTQVVELSTTLAGGACDPRPALSVQSIRQIVEQTVERVTPRGLLTIRQRWPKAEVNIFQNGEPLFSMDSTLPLKQGEEIDLMSVTLRAEQQPNGALKILSVDGSGPGVDRVRSIMEWAETTDASMLPEGPVKPGDKWRLGPRTFFIPIGGKVNYTPEATFSGYATERGRRVAVIDLVANDIEVANDAEREIVVELRRFMIKGRIVWDLAIGRPLSSITLVDFAGLGRASGPDRRRVLVHAQATLQTTEEP